MILAQELYLPTQGCGVKHDIVSNISRLHHMTWYTMVDIYWENAVVHEIAVPTFVDVVLLICL